MGVTRTTHGVLDRQSHIAAAVPVLVAVDRAAGRTAGPGLPCVDRWLDAGGSVTEWPTAQQRATTVGLAGQSPGTVSRSSSVGQCACPDQHHGPPSTWRTRSAHKLNGPEPFHALPQAGVLTRPGPLPTNQQAGALTGLYAQTQRQDSDWAPGRAGCRHGRRLGLSLQALRPLRIR
jgi:hypothetical protein